LSQSKRQHLDCEDYRTLTPSQSTPSLLTDLSFKEVGICERWRLKYLTFLLADQLCGIDLSSVRELLGYMPFTTAASEHPAVMGHLSLRGQPVRVMDLRVRFGLPVTRTDDTVMIIVEFSGALLALIVDKVTGLERIAKIDPLSLRPQMRIDPRCITGTAAIGDRMVWLLELARTVVIPPPLPKAA
jgi:purine-binding chemotaxis protein CheW